MVWFSQHINFNRGLEQILPHLKAFDNIELHLIGVLNHTFYNKVLKSIPNIICHEPIPQIQLHEMLADFDIGLALDMPVDLNRDLVVTNKILAYLQAGLYVLATKTSAQFALLNNYPEHGICFNPDSEDIRSTFERVSTTIHFIRNNKSLRFSAFHHNSWEQSALELLRMWKN